MVDRSRSIKTIIIGIVILSLLSGVVYLFLEMRKLQLEGMEITEGKEQTETDLAVNTERIKELEEETVSLEAQVQSLESQIQIQSLESQTLESQIQSLESQIQTLESQIQKEKEKTQEWKDYSGEVREWGEYWQERSKQSEVQRTQEIEYDKKRITDINNIIYALKVYHYDNQRYPDSLMALQEEGYLKSGTGIEDPKTGNPYYYGLLDGQYVLCIVQYGGFYGINLGSCSTEHQY